MFVLAYLVSLALWFASARRLPLLSLSVILAIAVLCRALFLFAEPELSTDVYRYRWDGRMTEAGVSPYSAAPAATAVASRPPWFDRINHPEVPTIYPPLAELLFLIWARGVEGLSMWRIILMLFDLATLTLLASTCGRRVALTYAICPFVIVEGFWSGHLEIAVTAALLAGVAAMSRKREVRSAISLAIAIGLKVTPIAVVAEMIRASRRRMRFAMILAAAVVLPLTVFIGGPIMPGAREYATRWSFNSPLFAVSRWTIEAMNVSDRLKGLFTAVKDSLGLEPVALLVYSHLYSDFITRALLGVLWIAGMVFLLRRSRPLWVGAAEAFTLMILLSPTIHPWYLLPLLPLALWAGRNDLVLLAGLSPASYMLYQSPGFQPLVYVICYGVPAVAAFAGARCARPTQH